MEDVARMAEEEVECEYLSYHRFHTLFGLDLYKSRSRSLANKLIAVVIFHEYMLHAKSTRLLRSQFLTFESGYTNSNDAITISLVSPSLSGIQKLHSFQPKFTYPIFGDEEQIFGYKGLKINLRSNISDLRPHLAIKYDKKTKPIGEEEPLDINAVLEEFLPKSM